ncbi:hypothetical protein [Mucilaginibacter sp.]|uniref:hypothetical protein n=1 Tax=Mucilaginibacter sp. TaxID=1882438 RepID=UPI00345DFDA4
MLISHVTWPNRLRLNKYSPAFLVVSSACFVIVFAIKSFIMHIVFYSICKIPDFLFYIKCK